MDETVIRVRVSQAVWREVKARAALLGKPAERLVGEILAEWIRKEGKGSETRQNISSGRPIQ